MARGGEHLAQNRADSLRFLVNLLVAQSLHFKTERAQLEIPSPVIAKCLLPAVILVAISFDHEAEIAPNEIRLVFADLDVDFRPGQTESPADRQEVALEVAAGAVVGNVLAERQTENVCLPNRPAQLLLGDDLA